MNIYVCVHVHVLCVCVYVYVCTCVHAMHVCSVCMYVHCVHGSSRSQKKLRIFDRSSMLEKRLIPCRTFPVLPHLDTNVERSFYNHTISTESPYR